MNEQRPDPDALLEKVQRAEAKRRRGRLKIFFGASAGVGKTFGMLLAARERRAEGLDVVAGYVETHQRAETEQLLEGLETLPMRMVDYQNTTLREFDLDAALKRHPALILVDELAHTNAPDSRHAKRWQDVEELLDAGIDVYTAVNVQHIESLNDVISQITGIPVWETVPDAVVEEATEIELIDLPPDELLQRLKEGKVYLPQQAERAAKNFFRKGNLIALRELALRRTADRVDAQMRDYRDDHAIQNVWQVKERLLVCIGPGGTAENLVRAAYRLAQLLRAEWVVVYIETAKLQRLSRQQRDDILRALKLAEELGAETATLSGYKLAEEVIAYARTRNATRIVLGKPTRSEWKRWLFGSLVDTIIRQARDIDIHVVGKESNILSLSRENPYFSRSRLYLGLASEEQQPMFKWRAGYLWAFVCDGHQYRHILGHIRALRPGQPDHGLPVGRGGGGCALRTRAVGAEFVPGGGGLRFLFCTAAIQFCRFGQPIPDHVRRHVAGRAGDQRHDGEHPSPGQDRRPPRASHSVVVRLEPRTGGDARRGKYPAHRGQARGGGI